MRRLELQESRLQLASSPTQGVHPPREGQCDPAFPCYTAGSRHWSLFCHGEGKGSEWVGPVAMQCNVASRSEWVAKLRHSSLKHADVQAYKASK